MSSRFLWLAIRGCILLLLSLSSAYSQYTNGIYAEFNTSMGSFTCRLDYVVAPKACANFIGLASGQRPWLSLPSGQVTTNPFYNGTTFHRVVPGFIIQGGSPNGLGTDGPGWTFTDEFSPTLRHDRFGVLAMANSGPDSNGSQFYVTVEPTPWLDDVHTIFGGLYGGSNVVYAINNVATDGSSKPLTNVVVQTVDIRRIGTDAQAFDINAQNIPWATGLRLGIAQAGTNLSLSFSNQLYVDNRFYTSTNLLLWNAIPPGLVTVPPVPGSILASASSPTRYFRMAQVQYQDVLFVPPSLLNRTVALAFTNVFGTLTITFNNPGGGSYTWSLGSPGTVTGYSYVQDPYRGRLVPILFSGVMPMALHLDFDSATAGTFIGTAYPNYPFSIGSGPVGGSFTASPP